MTVFGIPLALLLLCLFGGISLVAFLLYGADKRKAKKRQWRIRESVLLSFGFFGGAVGALVGMSLFRHKTRHWYFWAVNLLGVAWQAAVLLLLP